MTQTRRQTSLWDMIRRLQRRVSQIEKWIAGFQLNASTITAAIGGVSATNFTADVAKTFAVSELSFSGLTGTFDVTDLFTDADDFKIAGNNVAVLYTFEITWSTTTANPAYALTFRMDPGTSGSRAYASIPIADQTSTYDGRTSVHLLVVDDASTTGWTLQAVSNTTDANLTVNVLRVTRTVL